MFCTSNSILDKLPIVMESDIFALILIEHVKDSIHLLPASNLAFLVNGFSMNGFLINKPFITHVNDISPKDLSRLFYWAIACVLL